MTLTVSASRANFPRLGMREDENLVLEASYVEDRSPAPAKVAISTTSELIEHGLQAMLHTYRDRILLVSSTQQRGGSTADLTLFDADAESVPLGDVVADMKAGPVVLYTSATSSEMIDAALMLGCYGCLDKALSSVELVHALEDIVVSSSLGGGDSPVHIDSVDEPWPGHSEGLSQRAGEILVLIARGLTNHEIADFYFLSVNTVKYYIRAAYRKIDVDTRSQAVRWACERGIS